MREPTTPGNELNGLDLIAEEIFGSRLPSEALGTVWGTQDAATMAAPDHHSSTATKQSQAAASPSLSGSTASPYGVKMAMTCCLVPSAMMSFPVVKVMMNWQEAQATTEFVDRMAMMSLAAATATIWED